MLCGIRSRHLTSWSTAWLKAAKRDGTFVLLVYKCRHRISPSYLADKLASHKRWSHYDVYVAPGRWWSAVRRCQRSLSELFDRRSCRSVYYRRQVVAADQSSYAEFPSIVSCGFTPFRWISSNRLKVNADKTLFINFGLAVHNSCKKIRHVQLTVDGVDVVPLACVRDLGVTLDLQQYCQ